MGPQMIEVVPGAQPQVIQMVENPQHTQVHESPPAAYGYAPSAEPYAASAELPSTPIAMPAMEDIEISKRNTNMSDDHLASPGWSENEEDNELYNLPTYDEAT